MNTVRKQVLLDKYAVEGQLTKYKNLYPVTGEPNPMGVERFAMLLRKKMLKRHPAVFREFKLLVIWEEAVSFIKYHKLERYIDDVLDHHNSLI